MVSPRWQKVIDDLWNNKGRTLLVVLAIAVGVMLFGGIFITQEVMAEQMQNSYRETNPSTITMIVSPFEDDLVQAVQDLREVQSASGQIYYSAKLLVGDESYNLQLIALDDYADIGVNQIWPGEGEWPPGKRDVLLERTTVPVTGAEIGDSIQIELPDGEQRELAVSGVVHSLSVYPFSMSLLTTGYVSTDTLKWLGHPGTYNQLNIVTPPGVTDLNQINALAGIIKDRIEADGYVVGSVSTREPTENLVADSINGVTDFLTGIGVFSLLLSAFLVINTITAIMAQQKRQIGILKAIGATGSQVSTLYLSLVAAFGVLALAIALPLGALMASINARIVLDFANYNLEHFYIPLRVFLMMAAAAIFGPLIAALLPIFNGVRVTVREAISDYGTGRRARETWIDRLLVGLKGLPRPMMLSLRNAFRRKGRLILTLSTLTLAGAIFIGVLNTRESLIAFIDVALDIYGFDIQIGLSEPQAVATINREALRIPGVTAAEGLVGANAQNVQSEDQLGSTFTIFGIPPDSVFTQPDVIEGRWLEPGDDRVIAITTNLADDENLSVGDRVTTRINIEDYEWTVVGIVAGAGNLEAYAPLSAMSEVLDMPGMATALQVATAEHTETFQSITKTELEERFKRMGIDVGATITQAEIIENNLQTFNFITSFMMTFAIFLGLVGGLGMTSTMSLNVLERTREIGVMRGIGASNRSLRGIVLVEGLVIAIISWFFALLVSLPMSWVLRTSLGMAMVGTPLTPAYSVVGFVLWLPIVIVLAVVSSLIPARRAARLSVREALAYE